jgi:hypothetical protein
MVVKGKQQSTKRQKAGKNTSRQLLLQILETPVQRYGKNYARRLSHDQNSKSFVGRNITSPAFTLTRSIFQLG